MKLMNWSKLLTYPEENAFMLNQCVFNLRLPYKYWLLVYLRLYQKSGIVSSCYYSTIRVFIGPNMNCSNEFRLFTNHHAGLIIKLIL